MLKLFEDEVQLELFISFRALAHNNNRFVDTEYLGAIALNEGDLTI